VESARRRFPRGALLVVVAVFAGLIALFVSLGLWQLDRAAEKRAQLAAFDAGGTQPELAALPSEADAALYATVAVSGRYDASRQVLLDAITYRGAAGYQVLTPFEPLGSSRWLLVNRGWVPAGAERSDLPRVAVAEDRREIVGRIAVLPRPGLRLGGAAESAGRQGIEVRLFPSAGELENDLGRSLYPYQLWLDPREPDGFVRDWHPGGLPPEQHWAYAVQWFALAALVVCIGGWLLLRELRGR